MATDSLGRQTSAGNTDIASGMLSEVQSVYEKNTEEQKKITESIQKAVEDTAHLLEKDIQPEIEQANKYLQEIVKFNQEQKRKKEEAPTEKKEKGFDPSNINQVLTKVVEKQNKGLESSFSSQIEKILGMGPTMSGGSDEGIGAVQDSIVKMQTILATSISALGQKDTKQAMLDKAHLKASEALVSPHTISTKDVTLWDIVTNVLGLPLNVLMGTGEAIFDGVTFIAGTTLDMATAIVALPFEIAGAIAGTITNAVMKVGGTFTEAMGIVGIGAMWEKALAELGKEIQFRIDLGKIDFAVAGRLGGLEEVRDATFEISNTVFTTGQDLETMRKAQIAFAQKGFMITEKERFSVEGMVKARKDALQMSKAALQTATLTGMQANDTANIFADWHHILQLGTLETQMMGMAIQSVAKNTGVMGDELTAAVKDSTKLVEALKDAGGFSVEAGKSFIKISAAAKKFGVEKDMSEIMQALASPTAFLNASAEKASPLSGWIKYYDTCTF